MAKSVSTAPLCRRYYKRSSLHTPVDHAIQAIPVAVIAIILVAAFLKMRSRRTGRSQSVAAVKPTVAGAEPKVTKYCSDCGAQISARAEICPKCGVRQSSPPTGFAGNGAGRTRLAAALFAILLGGLGLHKFYLGQVGWGVVYLLFCWTLIPAIIGLIEGISLLVMSDQAFAATYN